MELRSLDWDRLKIFQAVAEHGSISAAATQLLVSHAKISRDVEELELALRHELFVRSTRGMQLTPVGAEVLKSVRSMAESAEAIATRLVNVTQCARVVIGAQDAMATYWLARRLPEFLHANPNIEVVLNVVPDTPNLTRGDCDIAIQYEPPEGQNIVSRPLGWLHYILYASPSYLSIHGTPETMFDLGRHRFLMHSGYNKQKEAWSSKTPAWLEILSRAFQSNSSTVLLETCAGGGGVLPMPSYVSEFDPRVKPLTAIPPLATARFWLAYTERMRGLQHYEPVLAWIRGCFDPEVHACFREVYRPPI